jgi:tetratricopeptide (TPR) repeat protein
MFSEDYIIRMIRQATGFLARVIGLKTAGQYQEALRDIDQALELILGMDAEIIRLLDDESLYKILTNNAGLDLEKLRLLADLFKEEGDIQKLMGQKTESINGYVRSLNYYLMISINSETSLPIEITQRIDELLQKMEPHDLNGMTLLNLFCFYENAGEYANADEMLNRLSARNDSGVNVVDETRSFYKRLIEKSPQELFKGGMSSTRVLNKLKELE